MFTLAKSQFHKDPQLRHTISNESLLSIDMKYFDKEGFELNAVEQAYYRINGVHIGKHLHHTACQADWILGPTEPRAGAYFDHAMILTRWDYQGAARDQLEIAAQKRPQLNKLLKIKPKWGIDIAMEYQWPDGDITELFHIEIDKDNLDEIHEWKKKIEDIVLNTDWTKTAQGIMDRKSEWLDMNADDQSDWLCRFVGLPRAYDTIKVL